mmetsp:Transcript_24179/g.24456  ORF Transcript_24179/g.24456 Transcript_24179/m.24456 type:complete len:171 (+) Transcript_24179:3427-3939(+)
MKCVLVCSVYSLLYSEFVCFFLCLIFNHYFPLSLSLSCFSLPIYTIFCFCFFLVSLSFISEEPEKPRVPRASQTTFCDWVTTMQSRINTDWHLIVSFNEWGEGTSVESATAWESDSGYGIYLDCLHDPIKYGGSSVVNVDNNKKNYNDIMTSDNMDLQEYINSRLKLGEK